MIKPNRENVSWMAAGTVVMILLFLIVFHFYQKQNPAEQLAYKASRVDSVGQMQLALALASEAEKSAVLAITDHDSQTFADQARMATTDVEQASRQLEKLLKTGGTQGEKDLLNQFSDLFKEFRRIDNELLNLAVKNTNIKAYSLAYGPATASLNEMNAALSRLIASTAGSPREKQVMRLAYSTEISGLHIQTLIPPHIAEESDQKMDELEARMAKEHTQLSKNLDELSALPILNQNADLATAVASYARFVKIKTEIIALSRENTNVKSLSISLNQKHKVTLLCQDVLNKLQQAILEEPITGVTYGRPARPR
jgi:hypothetical protein